MVRMKKKILFWGILAVAVVYVFIPSKSQHYRFEDPIAMKREIEKISDEEIRLQALDQKFPKTEYAYGSAYNTSDATADLLMGGVTLRIPANEIEILDLDGGRPYLRKYLKDDINSFVLFSVSYPDFKGHDKDNYEDFKKGAYSKKLWLSINLRPTCVMRTYPQNKKEMIAEIKKGFPKCYDSSRYLRSAFLVYGQQEKQKKFDFNQCMISAEEQKRTRPDLMWVYKSSIENCHIEAKLRPEQREEFFKYDKYPELSNELQVKGLKFYGYILRKTYGSTDLKGKFTFNPTQKVENFLYVKGDPEKSDNFEFITCGISSELAEKYKNINFETVPFPRCYHYFMWKKQFEVKIGYYYKEFLTDWQKIRNLTEDYLDNMVVKEEERTPIYTIDKKNGDMILFSDDEVDADVKKYKKFINNAQ